MPMPCRALIAEHRDVAEAVGVEQPAYVGEHRLAARLRHGVDVVEHDQHHARGGRPAARGSGRGSRRRRTSAGRAPTPAGRRARPAGRPRGGGRPRSSRGRAGRAARRRRGAWSSRPVSSIESRMVWWRGGMPSQSSSSSAPSLAPDAGGRPRRRRPADADGGEVEPGERVERRGLARPGGAGDRDDGVVGGQPRAGRRRARRRRRRRRRGRRRGARGRPSRPRRGPRCAGRCRCPG